MQIGFYDFLVACATDMCNFLSNAIVWFKTRFQRLRSVSVLNHCQTVHFYCVSVHWGAVLRMVVTVRPFVRLSRCGIISTKVDLRLRDLHHTVAPSLYFFVFCWHRSIRMGSHPSGALNTPGVWKFNNFRPVGWPIFRYISETVEDRRIRPARRMLDVERAFPGRPGVAEKFELLCRWRAVSQWYSRASCFKQRKWPIVTLHDLLEYS